MKDLNSASARRNTGSKECGRNVFQVEHRHANPRGNVPCSLNLCITEVSHSDTKLRAFSPFTVIILWVGELQKKIERILRDLAGRDCGITLAPNDRRNTKSRSSTDPAPSSVLGQPSQQLAGPLSGQNSRSPRLRRW